MKRLLAFVALAALPFAALAQPASAGGGSEIFVPSASVKGITATFPAHRGRTTAGVEFTYIVIEASTSSAADRFKVKQINKLANVGTAAQAGYFDRGVLVVEAGVDFSPARIVAGTPGTGFPPVAAQPGSVGEAGYSPLVRLPDGSIINAPQLANSSGLHDKVTAIGAKSVSVALTRGFARDEAVRYLSTDASAEGPAALEGSTFAPRLAQAPRAGDDSTDSGRASLAAFVNGPVGSTNPQRQGINSALLGEGDPLNILAWLPNQGRYSPLWDVHLTAWAPGQTPARVIRFADVEDLAEDGAVTAPDGTAWAANDIVVNCPIIALG